MPTPRTPYEAVLNAARDVARLDCAFEAELLGSALLGSVYAVAEDDRAAAVRAFVGGFLNETSRRRSASATVIRGVFATLVPDAPGAGNAAPGGTAAEAAAPDAEAGVAADAGTGAEDGDAPAGGRGGPAWVRHLGRVRPTGTYAYGDVYGDQTSYVATFAYDDAAEGGPEHAVVALIDHNIGIAKDIFVGGPAEVVVGQIRELCGADEQTWFDDSVPAERVHDEIARHLSITDSLGSLPGEGSLATDRALVGARLALLPGAGGVEPKPLDAAGREALTAEFLASREAADAGLSTLDVPGRLALDFSLRLILDHAETFPDADPLRWSPVMAELFLLDWVHRRAVLDDNDAAMLPRALRAWAAFAARVRRLPSAAVERTLAAIDELAPEFGRLHASGERRGAAAQAMANLIADGVDPSDTDAVAAWLRSNGNRTN